MLDQMVKIAGAFALAVLVAGCTAPFARPKLEPDNVAFVGIQHALEEAGAAEVLFVHGICTHTEADLKAANAALAVALDMQPRDAKDVVLRRVWGNDNAAQLFTTTLTHATKSVTTYSLLWSPITTRYKQARLCYDVSSPTESCPEELLTYDKPRVRVSKFAKDILLDECLADAVFYLGRDGGALIRAAALEALLHAFAGAPGQVRAQDELLKLAGERRSPLFIVTHSLGSKITADALQEVKDEAALTRALARTYQVFMQANQLPMLSVGVGPVTDGRFAAAATDHALESLLSRIRKGRSDIPQLRALARRLPLVAFSDPNDVLTWGLNGSGVKFSDTDIIDVWVSNATSWFGIFADPRAAHVAYAVNPAVAKLIACGWNTPDPPPACR